MSAPRTKHQFANKRQHRWACTDCAWSLPKKFKSCPECSSPNVAYFASTAEFLRWTHLRLGVLAGLFSHLQLQPEFPIDINGQHVCTYRADFSYTDLEKKKIIVEDVKGTTEEKYLDPVFKLKRKLVKAVYGLDIEIVKA